MVEIFFSYAHADEDLMNDVRRQLIIHERNGRILKWYDRQIPPGDEWRSHIDRRLNRAQIILLFVSPHFIESKYCYEIEGKLALQRHMSGTARVLPIILRPCPWQKAPFSKLQALPRDAKPVSRWDDRDEACLSVANGVMAVVDEIVKLGSKKWSQRNTQASRAARKPAANKQPHKAPQPKSRARKNRKATPRSRAARG
jgi:hypothetical protein